MAHYTCSILVYHRVRLFQPPERKNQQKFKFLLLACRYHETFLVVVIGSIVQVVWFIPLRKLTWLQNYRLDKNRPQDANRNSVKTNPTYTFGGIIRDTLRYTIPLLLLDTFTRKYYHGVDEDIYYSRPYFGWQTERLLPQHAPSLREIIWQTIVGLMFYDAFFYFVHRAFHTLPTLMKYIHGIHHRHTTVRALSTQTHIGCCFMSIFSLLDAGPSWCYKPVDDRGACFPHFDSECLFEGAGCSSSYSKCFHSRFRRPATGKLTMIMRS